MEDDILILMILCSFFSTNVKSRYKLGSTETDYSQKQAMEDDIVLIMILCSFFSTIVTSRCKLEHYGLFWPK